MIYYIMQWWDGSEWSSFSPSESLDDLECSIEQSAFSGYPWRVVSVDLPQKPPMVWKDLNAFLKNQDVQVLESGSGKREDGIKRAIANHVGKKILSLGEITIVTEAGELVVSDSQQCCESRYFTTDDDLESFVGAIFTGIELRSVGRNEKESPYESNEEGCHEVTFLYINTSLGPIVFEAHNIHNGCYSGFDITVRENN